MVIMREDLSHHLKDSHDKRFEILSLPSNDLIRDYSMEDLSRLSNDLIRDYSMEGLSRF